MESTPTPTYGVAARARAVLVTAIAAVASLLAAPAMGQQPAPHAESSAAIRVIGDVATPLTLGAAEFAALPHQQIRASLHDRAGLYRGVPVAVLLDRAGVPSGSAIRGKAVRLFVVVRGADGYAAVFSRAELDAAFMERTVLVADSRDGAAFGPEEGPLRLVVPGEAPGARWVRQVTAIEVLSAP